MNSDLLLTVSSFAVDSKSGNFVNARSLFYYLSIDLSIYIILRLGKVENVTDIL